MTATAFIQAFEAVGYTLAGFAAGEGCFTSTQLRQPRRDGSIRRQFRFQVTVAERDQCVLEALRQFLRTGSIFRSEPSKPRHQPDVTFCVSGRLALRTHVIPFMDRFLLPSRKERQYRAWRREFVEYESQHPSRWGAGRSTCAVEGCEGHVRGRGLCRRHYYRATGW